MLIKHAQATFLMRVAGGAMREAGIDDGDLVLVDRAIAPAHGHVVIAVVDDEFVCRRLCHAGQRAAPARGRRRAWPTSCPARAASSQVWGVVTHAIKSMPV